VSVSVELEGFGRGEGVRLLPIANSLLKGKICLKLALSPLGDMKVGMG